ncbi:pilus assembly protein [Lujinxingia vulgaris]|uniref:Pilus assembly protein n=1 Tax=Lujinxingia vulgaris TaxID=2600176 RepID=A0A5C6X6R2_9DELT|nr:TadE family protein [Lujinxingia vulgaris]TXD35379.1 pilus assembly protein [Lujinxingia vulgaris]
MNLVPTAAVQSRPRLLLGGARILIHLGGIASVALIMALPFVSQRTIGLALQAREAGIHQAIFSLETLVHVGLAACFWAMLYLSWSWFQITRQERKARGPRPSRTIVRARGNVILETLVVFPIFLLLIFGLAQFAVLNIASMLTTVAAFQATRTVWIWEREPVGPDEIERKAVIQAASVVAPVVPGEYAAQPSTSSSDYSENRGIFVASQFPWPVADSGYQGRNIGDRLADEMAGLNPPIDFVSAVDTAAFSHRTVRKLTSAYGSIDVSFEPDAASNSLLKVTTTYHHLNAFPLVAGLFGQNYERAGREGYHVPITRVLSIERQRPSPDRTQFPRMLPGGGGAEPYLF